MLSLHSLMVYELEPLLLLAWRVRWWRVRDDHVGRGICALDFHAVLKLGRILVHGMWARDMCIIMIN